MDKKSVVSAFPLKCFYLIKPDSCAPSQIAVIVSKRRFKHAVDRNRVKRLIREAYRLQKHQLTAEDRSLQLCWMFVGKELPDFAQIQESVAKIIRKINLSFQEENQ